MSNFVALVKKKLKRMGRAPEDYGLVLKKKGPKPVWLAEHQLRFGEASKRASEETKNLSGPARIAEMHRLVSKYIREADGKNAGSA